MMGRLGWLGALLLLLAPGIGTAQEVVFYKCTDAKGTVSVQNGTACAAGMKQEIRRVGEVRTVPVPANKPAAAPEQPAPVLGDFVLVSGPNMKHTPAPESAALPLPPPLFQCRTWDGTDYLGEDSAPPSRCVPLQIIGIDGSQQSGAASACEMRDDTCTEIPQDGLCEAWFRRLDEAEFKRNYASDNNRAERQSAFDRIDADVKASRCSPVAPSAAPASTPSP